MRQEGNHIIADEGKVFIRKATGEDCGSEIYLGYSYYIGGELQDPPHLDTPEDFEEVPSTEEIASAEALSIVTGAKEGETATMSRHEAYEFRGHVEDAAKGLDDAAALESKELFPWWEVGVAVVVGDRLRYGESLYKVLVAHTTRRDAPPDEADTLFEDLRPEDWPEWVQPTSLAEAYNTGDKVSYEGHRYICRSMRCMTPPGPDSRDWRFVE